MIAGLAAEGNDHNRRKSRQNLKKICRRSFREKVKLPVFSKHNRGKQCVNREERNAGQDPGRNQGGLFGSHSADGGRARAACPSQPGRRSARRGNPDACCPTGREASADGPFKFYVQEAARLGATDGGGGAQHCRLSVCNFTGLCQREALQGTPQNLFRSIQSQQSNQRQWRPEMDPEGQWLRYYSCRK
jgi:hypothetical protein